jgi:PPOX class probable FMN-dependent enzyme
MPGVEDVRDLRDRYPATLERSLRKQLDHIDRHCRRFIELSPFLVLASAGIDGTVDASPRGGPPGFVLVDDDHTLLVPDWPGNNRLDSLTNLVSAPGVGLLFLIPGVDETLRVNGTVEISADDGLRERFAADNRGAPRSVLVVRVREAYLHCAKALMRSRLWDPGARVPRDALPTMGEMMRDHIGSTDEPESQEAMVVRYREILYPERFRAAGGACG